MLLSVLSWIFVKEHQLNIKMTIPLEWTTNYECKLSQSYQNIALKELREDEARRTQALEQFRDWIKKHPFIKSCRTDDVFLLRFLRTKKFVMLAAYEMLEQYLKARQLYPQWFQNLDIEDSKLNALVDSGYILPLMQRDSQGRRIVLQSASRFDTNKFSSADSIRLNSLIFGYLMDEEESQICGYVYIIDASKVSLKHVSMFSFVDIKNWLNCLQKAIPTRMKEYHFINLPGYANTIVDFGLSVMSDKMKKRVFYGKNLDELKKHVDEKLLPKEYGGVVPMDTMIEDFKMKLHKYRDKILKNDDQFIIIPKTVTDENISELGIGGSFRKLEVD